MDASLASATLSFFERAASMLERVEHRCAISAHDKNLVYRMRYAAHLRYNQLAPRADGLLIDEVYDNSGNHYNVMTFLDDEFVSAFRVHVASGEDATLPSLDLFGDVVSPFLREGRVVADISRITAQLEYARKFPELPYLTIRAALLAADHFQADVVSATCFADQLAFYRRVFGFAPLSSPRAASHADREIVCVAIDYRAEKRRLMSSYPLFRSTEAERLSIFGPLGLSPRQG